MRIWRGGVFGSPILAQLAITFNDLENYVLSTNKHYHDFDLVPCIYATCFRHVCIYTSALVYTSFVCSVRKICLQRLQSPVCFVYHSLPKAWTREILQKNFSTINRLYEQNVWLEVCSQSPKTFTYKNLYHVLKKLTFPAVRTLICKPCERGIVNVYITICWKLSHA